MSKSAELSEDEEAHFIAGMYGDTSEGMPLNRRSYTHLQGSLESLELKRTNADRLHSRRIVYLTPRPLTPFYKPDHARRELARALFTDGPFAISAISEAVLQELCNCNILDPRERQAVAEVIRSVKHRVKVFSMGEVPNNASFMAMHPIATQGAIAFEAPQNRQAADGKLFFGQDARDMYYQAFSAHEKNVAEGRGHNAVLKLLEEGLQ
ncbi:MAG TPA: hypothetical protein VI588_02050 [Candidatus Gracilibacteria bacterium]|nr:hypothetical protein [Candidatus Gracilibacteria bacterium]